MLEDKIILQDRGFDAGLAGEATASVIEVAKLLNLLLN